MTPVWPMSHYPAISDPAPAPTTAIILQQTISNISHLAPLLSWQYLDTMSPITPTPARTRGKLRLRGYLCLRGQRNIVTGSEHRSHVARVVRIHRTSGLCRVLTNSHHWVLGEAISGGQSHGASDPFTASMNSRVQRLNSIIYGHMKLFSLRR